MDVFESFDIALPRHSGWQAQAGSFTVDVADMKPAEKLQALDQAPKSGVVLLAFPGHIMLHLGKNAAGVPMVLHALGEYVQPCAGGKGETVLDVQRTVVSDLALGAGTSRRSLLERVATLVVLGKAPTPAARRARRSASVAAGAATGSARRVRRQRERAHLRLAGCGRSQASHAPDRDQRSTRSAAPALWLYDSKGALVERRAASPERSAGRRCGSACRAPPPDATPRCSWTARSMIGCTRLTVHEQALAHHQRAESGPGLETAPRVGTRRTRSVVGVRRAAVRRPARRRADLDQLARAAARSGAQPALQPLRPARRRSDRARARLRRPALLAARVLLLEARLAVRLPAVLARAHRRAADLRPVADEPHRRATTPNAGDVAAFSSFVNRKVRCGRALGDRAHAPRRLEHRSVSGRPGARVAAARHRVRRSRTGTS